MPNNERTTLHIAAMQNNCEYLKNEAITSEELLDTFIGNTPLLWGVANSSVSFVLALLDLPDTTHVNVKSTLSSHLNTPLIFSVSKGWTHLATRGRERNPQMDIAIKLLQKGAEVNAVDVHGRTVLHYACLHRNLDAIAALVKAGAAWDIKDKNSQTPLDFCCTGYETASKILDVATGGPKDYTYTLLRDNFDSSSIFYQSLSSLLAKDNQFVTVERLKQAYEFNQKVDYELARIYSHAKKIFDQHATKDFFEDYAKSIMRADSLNYIPFELPDSMGSRKLNSLLMTYFELQHTASARIDCSQMEMSFKKQEIKQIQEIEQILNNALKNPELMAERRLLTRVGMVILNLISILGAGLPLLANYYKTGQVFFSHQTKTEQLLNHFKDEMTLCING